jgi:hypothetical protein
VDFVQFGTQSIFIVFTRAPKTHQRLKFVVEYQFAPSGVAEVKLERPTSRERGDDLGRVEVFAIDDVQ